MSHSLFFPHDALFLPSTWRAVASQAHHAAESSSSTTHHQMSTSSSSSSRATRGSHVSEDDDCILLTVDVPGVKAKHLNVKIENGVLSISGCRTMKLGSAASVDQQQQGGTKKYKFCKTFAIDSHTVDISQAKANLADGVLVFTAPKKAKPDCIVIPVTEDPNEESDGEETSDQAIAETKAASIPSGSGDEEEVNVVKTVEEETSAAGVTGEEK